MIDFREKLQELGDLLELTVFDAKEMNLFESQDPVYCTETHAACTHPDDKEALLNKYPKAVLTCCVDIPEYHTSLWVYKIK
jgi:hypothetical protein